MLSGYTPVFTSYNESVYEMAATRSAIRDNALGVVHYKRGDIADTKKYFGSTSNVSNDSKLMLANCFEKEGNYAEAERLLLEMADNAWKGNIHAHKKLWSYYITGNKGVALDYWKSFEYAKKYFESEGMDEATAREMMGKSCINMAHDLQEGNHGIEVDIKKARELYEAAVGFGNQEALLPLALMLWVVFASKVNMYGNLKYKTDFDLGDVVTCVNKRWGVKINVRITEVSEVYQDDTEGIEVTFGESLPTLFDKIRNIRV